MSALKKEPFNSDKISATGDSEKEAIIKSLDRTAGNKAKAARLLGISRGTLYNKILKYGIE